MRVRISYGVDIKDIPEQVTKLLEESLERMKEIQDLLTRAKRDMDNCEQNSAHIVNTLDRARQGLGANDLTLSDVQSIMVGLANYYNGEQNVSDRRPTMDPSGDTTAETTDSREG
tara:strand:- start:275 stop:619 length:345 start_codon:yes stop_codon:yes gene_type:complete